MTPEEAAKKYLDEGFVMQLGTSKGTQSRVNSVYYVPSDDHYSMYWMSEPRRRHSVDVKDNSNVSGAIVIKPDWPVIGLQFIGIASEIHDLAEIKRVIDQYNAKYNYAAKDFVQRYEEGKNKHILYKLKITNLELFDQENFAGDPVEIPLD